uniref:Uncharacterized protein n=1 Tax=Oryza brachyantha TaxID=4533 RepID=J3L5B6_ORYBR
MGAHTRSMSWYMGTPSSPGTGSGSSTGEAQHALSSSGGAGGGSDASFDTNMVIILAALLFALLFALGLNSLARLVIRTDENDRDNQSYLTGFFPRNGSTSNTDKKILKSLA